MCYEGYNTVYLRLSRLEKNNDHIGMVVYERYIGRPGLNPKSESVP